MFIGAVFLISRLAYGIVSYLSARFVPYGGFFPYKELLQDYHLPYFIYSFGNFDGIHYIQIAKKGYDQYEQAFFPLYSLAIHYVSPIFARNYLVTGLIVSNVAFVVGLSFFSKYLKEALAVKNIRWITLFLIFFPTSFYFGSIYTEGLFFALFFSSLYYLYRKQFLIAVFLAVLCSLTRLMGVFLIIPFLFYFIRGKRMFFSVKELAVIISPVIGLFIYMIYLWKSVGDPLFFLNAQPAFGAHRSSHLILLPQVFYRYIKILLTSTHNFQYSISQLEFFSFIFIFGILLFDLWTIYRRRTEKSFFLRLGLNLFSFVNIVLPTFTGTFSSVPRYALLSFSVYIVLGELKNRFVKVILLGIFLVLQIILLAYFIQGYFIS